MTSSHSSEQRDDAIEMPRPTAWPLVLSVGLTLALAGIVTNYALTGLGVVMVLAGLSGWIYQLLPGVGHEYVPLVTPAERVKPIVPSGVPVVPLKPGMPGHRARLPEKMHPYSAGAKGGLIGGAAMAATALLYGQLSGHGIWYPINLLAGMVLRDVGSHPQTFNLAGLLVATLIHGITSLGVGLFFGVLLPTLPRWPIFWGGIVGPILWTGAIYSFMGVLNPLLARQVDWRWFIVSQFAYGLVMGVVVTRSEKVSAEKVRLDGFEKKEPGA